MKIAILGGSFNPIHIGHLSLADEVCVSLGYDKVLFVPAFSPPHKTMNGELSPETRACMVRLACEDDSRFEMEPCEIQRGGVSYTYDTVRFIEEKYKPSGKVGLVIGRDLFSTFHLWNRAQELAERCELILAERPFQMAAEGFGNSALGEYQAAENSSCAHFRAESEPLFKNAVFLKNEPLAVSSSDIRFRAAGKMAFQYLVPSKVFKYIIDGSLYGRKN
ncbi:nicotinate (nicotinamide) nucleotide adenylyltransferase [Treponema sp.]|uniref:nicotinate (nicotinamide) nucleotide adenylyltransferase n=1 Tax=Treponema sp. TaxID=166 RepID=UPI003F0B733F